MYVNEGQNGEERHMGSTKERMREMRRQRGAKQDE